MAAAFRHFAINADGVSRARRFYEQVFGWRFDPWGPPNFYQVRNAGDGIVGALQQRRELVPGVRASGYESTIGVEDIRAAIAAVEASGRRIVAPPFRIEGVGELFWFEDTEGNLVGAMQYDPGAFDRGSPPSQADT